MPVTSPHALPFSLRLRHHGRDISLRPGSYVLGRHSTADVKLESGLASRRHARIEVGHDFAAVEDLHSANGVWLNGERVGVQPARLRTGDCLLIGDEEIEVEIDAPVRSESGELVKLTPSRPAWYNDNNDGDDEPPSFSVSERSSPGTREADFFELVGKIVDRVLAEGRYEDAATMLQAQMGKVLADARAGRVLADNARDGTLRYCAELAKGTGDPRWLAHALDVMTALASAPSGALAGELLSAFAAAEPVDGARFSAYLASAERIESPLERMRVTQWAREIERASLRRSR
jgi:pSer/pThr/pTyr-binding forkhead associated (FHA) protein